MLKVLQITNKAPYPPDDGSCIAVCNMANGFIQNNASVTLLAINTRKHFKPDEKVPDDFKRKTNYVSVYRDTNTTAMGALINLFSSRSYFVSRFYFKEFEDRIIEILKADKFDIVQLEGLFVADYIETIRKYSKAKLVLRAHNVEYLIWERHIKVEKSFIKRKYLEIQKARLERFEKEVLNKVDVIVSITDVDAESFKKLSPSKKVITCITGVDTLEYAKPGNLPMKPKTVFYFASMDWLPNQEAVDWFLEKCWSIIHQAVPEAQFVIAGKNMPQRFTKCLMPNVRAIESVPNGKDFYKQHDVMVVPLLSGSGLRIKIIEGMSYGKAIISTSIGAEGVSAENGKDIILADEPVEFANAVIKVLKDVEIKEQIEKNALAFAAVNFDNNKIVERLVQQYKELNV